MRWIKTYSSLLTEHVSVLIQGMQPERGSNLEGQTELQPENLKVLSTIQMETEI